jgi:hypothetical protein
MKAQELGLFKYPERRDCLGKGIAKSARTKRCFVDEEKEGTKQLAVDSVQCTVKLQRLTVMCVIEIFGGNLPVVHDR